MDNLSIEDVILAFRLAPLYYLYALTIRCLFGVLIATTQVCYIAYTTEH